MAYKIVDKQYCAYTDADRFTFVLDSDEDVASLPTCSAGSTAMVATENGSVYMTNTLGEWRKL